MTKLYTLFGRLTPLQRSLVASVLGFFFYGAWAFWVNSVHGTIAALKSACVQGSYSFILTLCMTILIEGLYRLNDRLFDAERMVTLMTILVSWAVIFGGSWALNAAAGTQEIFRTVILGYVIGGIYSIGYVQNLARINR